MNNSKNSGGFVAGTLVHTQTGLKPIEQIQVGDFVLSKSESGEQTYKRVRVSQTFRFENKAVYSIGYRRLEDESEIHRLIVTANHPFWVVGYDKERHSWWDGAIGLGWIRADYLVGGAFIQIADGELGEISAVEQLWHTSTDGVGWAEVNPGSGMGWLVDFREGKVQKDDDLVPREEQEDNQLDRYNDADIAEEYTCKSTVYNFEVEDFHTYFIGELGVWVHDAIQQTS